MTEALAERALAGDRRALARLLTLLEIGGPAAVAALRTVYPRAGGAHVIGLTGPAGSGKSTLAGALTRHFRAAGERVAVLAVDPTSPYTGGALLGDRVRMQELTGDDGVFVRSMASRGSLGGLTLATTAVLAALDAAGYPRILLETVGVGQDGVAVAQAAHTTVVVSVPGLGDEIQALKAGLLEIADVLVVNKADRPEADSAAAALLMLQSLAATPAWLPPVVKTSATTGEGIPALAEALDAHRAWLASSGEGERRAIHRARAAVVTAARAEMERRLDHAAAAPARDATWEAVGHHARSPLDAAEELVAAVLQVPTAQES